MGHFQPPLTALDKFVADNSKFRYDKLKSSLIVRDRITRKEYRDLVSFYPGTKEVHAVLKGLSSDSQAYLTDDELADLDTYAKRARGEILFARGWLLCEGQSEYPLLRCFADILGIPLDAAGISIVEYQNNGSPGAFVSLAKALEIPWLLICDNDDGGDNHIKELKNRGASQAEIKKRVWQLPGKGMDLESFLVVNGLLDEIIDVLSDRGYNPTKSPGDVGFEKEIVSKLQTAKRPHAEALADKLRLNQADISKVPKHFANALAALNKMVGI